MMLYTYVNTYNTLLLWTYVYTYVSAAVSYVHCYCVPTCIIMYTAAISYLYSILIHVYVSFCHQYLHLIDI